MQDIPLTPYYGNQSHFCMVTDETGNIIEIANPYAHGRARVATMDDFYHDYLAFYLEDTLRQQIEQGILKPHKLSRKIPHPMGATMTAMCLSHFDTVVTGENTICTDVIVQTSIELWDSSSGEYRSDTVEEWFRCPFLCDLSFGALSISALRAKVYRKQDKPEGQALDKYLIPIIPNNRLDGLAEQMLKAYYPEAMQQPSPVFGDILAARIGYGLMSAAITKEHDLQGQCFFAEDQIKVYNAVTDSQDELRVPEKTLLIDENPEHALSQWYRHDVSAHESLHAILDKHFFLLQHLFNEDLRCLSTPVEPDYWGDDNLPMRVIEARTAKLTPRVRMPATQTRRKIEELLETHHVTDRETLSSEAQARRVKNVIAELASFFCVSSTTARLRMIELGFSCAKGVMNYYGDTCAPWHSTALGKLAWNQTLTISLKDAAKAYTEDSRFASLIDSGCFIFIEGHFCLNDSKYIACSVNGEPQLTSYARLHMDECCLVFTIKGWSTSWEHTGGALYRESHADAGNNMQSNDAPTDDAYDENAILLAWRTGDNSSLSDMNRSILDAAKAAIAQEITGSMSDYEKELAIHDWMTGWSSFDMNVFSHAPAARAEADNRNPYGFLIDRSAMCHGYSSTFQLFMDMLDIECMDCYHKTRHPRRPNGIIEKTREGVRE